MRADSSPMGTAPLGPLFWNKRGKKSSFEFAEPTACSSTDTVCQKHAPGQPTMVPVKQSRPQNAFPNATAGWLSFLNSDSHVLQAGMQAWPWFQIDVSPKENITHQFQQHKVLSSKWCWRPVHVDGPRLWSSCLAHTCVSSSCWHRGRADLGSSLLSLFTWTALLKRSILWLTELHRPHCNGGALCWAYSTFGCRGFNCCKQAQSTSSEPTDYRLTKAE